MPIVADMHHTRALGVSLAAFASLASLLLAAPASAVDRRGVSQDEALDIALAQADVQKSEVRRLKMERGEEASRRVYKIEFETEFGDYDFAVAVQSGRIIDADYEVNDDWIRRQPRASCSAADAKRLAAGKAPGASPSAVVLKSEGEGREARWEGRFFHDGLKYEFEIDRGTCIIQDWNADLRE